jgi:hypothetical protein
MVTGPVCLLMQGRPKTSQEIYNLRHAQARNVIERIFGVLKRRFVILVHPPEYSMSTQARIPPALCAVHNFIRVHDPTEIEEFVDEDVIDLDPGEARGDLAEGPADRAERQQATEDRDKIAAAMWGDYTRICRARQNALEG